jgi:hypothetical protein
VSVPVQPVNNEKKSPYTVSKKVVFRSLYGRGERIDDGRTATTLRAQPLRGGVLDRMLRFG